MFCRFTHGNDVRERRHMYDLVVKQLKALTAEKNLAKTTRDAQLILIQLI